MNIRAKEQLNNYFEGVAWKYLSAVDAESKVSNQHELGGLVKAGFAQYLGAGGADVARFPAKFILLAEDEEQSTSADGQVSWYDTRRGQPDRSPEFRLYYDGNPVTENLSAGMFLFIGKMKNGGLVLALTEKGSSSERQLRWLFGLSEADEQFAAKGIDDSVRSSWATLWILEQLGIDVVPRDDDLLEKILNRFEGGFPATRLFSTFAREVAGDADVLPDPDNALVRMMDVEERLFRLLERHIVEQRLRLGFDDIDTFISYSLSVQNRRKSRVGHAFEHHIEHILSAHKIRFDRAEYTENRSKPDFLFPGIVEYRSNDFPADGLTMLGAKSTCKDRWRQVLAEAKRISTKHLVTLEPAISPHQTDEMRMNQLQLVVPSPIHETFTVPQQDWLWSVQEFLVFVRESQSKYS